MTEKEPMTVANLCSQLQSLAHEGYAIHALEIVTETGDYKVTLNNPTLEIKKTDHSVNLIFKNHNL